MTPIALLSMILISLALVCYSVGVWSERLQGRLKSWHLAFFWAGLFFDTVGTGMMMEMAGGITFDMHGLTGIIAIALMGVHALWATLVLWRGNEKWITGFHRFSLLVWLIWLIPYLNGFFLNR